jgi:cobalt-zinc-cadmium efflux system membrane fusion protein
MNHIRITCFVLFTLLGFACNPSPKPEAPPSSPAAVNATTANEVTLSDEQMKMANITIGKVETGTIHGTLKVTGTIDVPPGNKVTVSFPLGGYVKNLKLLPGTIVRKGTPLVQLEDQQYIQLQQDYLMALSRLEFLQQDYARQKELNASKASSDKQFQQAASDFQSQKVLVKALDEKLRLIGLDPSALNETNITRLLSVTAPISGMVSKVNVNNGQYINPTDVICELVNDDDKHLGLTILEKDINQLFTGQRLTCYSNNNPNKKYNARIMLINRNINEDRSGEIHCHFEADHRELIPGMFMNAEIELNNKKATLVPADAIIRWENNNYIFGVKEKNVFVMIPIQTGASSEGFTEITGGQLPDSIVTGNAYSLLMKMKNNTGEE